MKAVTKISMSWKLPSSNCRCREKALFPNWQVDRLFRNLLIDVTRQTPTAQKSASTSSFRPTGRPVASDWLSSARLKCRPMHKCRSPQQLLLRAIIVRLWEQPYRQRLVRFGTQLHDKFMLPHYVP